VIAGNYAIPALNFQKNNILAILTFSKKFSSDLGAAANGGAAAIGKQQGVGGRGQLGAAAIRGQQRCGGSRGSASAAIGGRPAAEMGLPRRQFYVSRRDPQIKSLFKSFRHAVLRPGTF